MSSTCSGINSYSVFASLPIVRAYCYPHLIGFHIDHSKNPVSFDDTPAIILASSYLTVTDLNDVLGTANFSTLLILSIERNHAYFYFATITEPVTDGSAA